jgi:hypothetical protein
MHICKCQEELSKGLKSKVELRPKKAAAKDDKEAEETIAFKQVQELHCSLDYKKIEYHSTLPCTQGMLWTTFLPRPWFVCQAYTQTCFENSLLPILTLCVKVDRGHNYQKGSCSSVRRSPFCSIEKKFMVSAGKCLRRCRNLQSCLRHRRVPER